MRSVRPFLSRTRAAAIALAVCSGVALANIEPPAAGTVAPDFKLPNQDGKEVGLKDLQGKWVVLYFYPKDFTGGCTLEAQNFQKDIAKYEAANAAVVGVSVDTADSHRGFCDKEGLKFT